MIAVTLISFGLIALSITVMSHAVSYADTITRREYRIRARVNVDACIESLKIMSGKDPFLQGKILLREFGCEAYIENNFRGSVRFVATSTVAGVKAHKEL